MENNYWDITGEENQLPQLPDVIYIEQTVQNTFLTKEIIDSLILTEGIDDSFYDD